MAARPTGSVPTAVFPRQLADQGPAERCARGLAANGVQVWVRSIGGRVDPAFSGRIRRLKSERHQEAVENLANDPTLLVQFKENLDATLRHSAAIFLARDPELSRVLGDFREWLTRFKRILEGYREVRQASRKSGTDPGRLAASDVSMQARVQLKELIIEAVRLQSCLARHAEEIRPFGSARRS